MMKRVPVWLIGSLLIAGFAAFRYGPSQQSSTASSLSARERMVQNIVAQGVKDPRVIRAMRATPRHEFVSAEQRQLAYEDRPLPIGEDQTISQPFVVAFMTERLNAMSNHKVLEVGTGSGYQAAVLSPLVREVYTIEIIPSLGEKAKRTLNRLGYKNVFVKIGDGYQGWEEHAPFDRMIVTCAPDHIPAPLAKQLKEGGRMIIPVGELPDQELYLIEKKAGELIRTALLPVLFVPMTGDAQKKKAS